MLADLPTSNGLTELLQYLTPEELAELDRLIQTAPKTQTFSEFYPTTLPPRWYTPPHVKLIAEHLDAVDRGEIDRLAISMPPRHGKSETVTVRYPLHCLMRWPEDNVLVTGYNQTFAKKFGRRTRNMAQDAGIVSDDKTASDEWATRGGGLYMARGVGSPPTGTGFHRIVVDDPIKSREEADSQTYRDKAWDWYSEDLYSRLEPGGAMILVGTRWHHDDVIARAIASEPGRWTILNLPSISDDGNALWPERYNVEALERIRSISPRAFESLYQGNPTPREGAFFFVDRIEVVDHAPTGLTQGRGWDLAATEGGGDFTATVKISGPDAHGIFYIEDAFEAQVDSSKRDALMLQTAKADSDKVKIRIPQDPGQAGKDQAARLVKMLAGFTVKASPVSGDKETRADAFASQVNAGNVRIVRGNWNATYIEKMRQFPLGKYDDFVDASADAFTALNIQGNNWEWDKWL
jgi:predicted phage terminase large subunit-like protein